MILLTPPSLLIQAPASMLFERVVGAEKAAASQHVIIQSTATGGAGTTASYDLSFTRPTKLLLRVKQGGSDRSYYVSGPQMLAYDRVENEYLTRRVQPGRTLLQRLAQALGDVDVPISLLLDPASCQNFFAALRPLPGWRVSQSAGGALLSRVAMARGSTSTVEISISRSYLPRSMRFSTGGRTLSWTFTYSPKPSNIALIVPAGARKVAAFFIHPTRPVFDTPAAAHVADKAIAAFHKARSLGIQVSGEEPGTIFWAGSSARQDQQRISWAYDGAVLTILDKVARRSYRGATSIAHIADYLAPLGARPDPLLRLLIARRNPLEVLFVRGMKGHLVGRIQIAGVPEDVLELAAAGIRIQVQIRTQDGLTAGFLTENLNAAGSVVTRSQRSFRYTSINHAFPRQVFTPNWQSGSAYLPIRMLWKSKPKP
jgi:hypothetical protein